MDTRFPHVMQRSSPHHDSSPPRGSLHVPHHFSDSALHSSLMVAVLAVAALAVVQAFNVGVLMWRLDPVVVTGKAQQTTPLPADPSATKR
jgi:hypothetical protein